MSDIGIVSQISGESYRQFGKEILITQMPFSMLEAIFEVDSEVQRKLDPNRRLQIREFIIQSLETNFEFMFSSFVFSSRGAIKQKEAGEWELVPGSKLYIIDGQHRCAALISAFSHLRAHKEIYEESGQYERAEQQQRLMDKLRKYPVAMQIYLDLDKRSERLLFTDLNTERREAHVGLIMQYDQRDAYASMARQIAGRLDHLFEIEHRLSRISHYSPALTSLSIMKKCMLALFEGILTVKKGQPSSLYIAVEEMESVGLRFFSMWNDLFPKKKVNRQLYVCGLTGIQMALAYTIFLMRRSYNQTYEEALGHAMSLKSICTWKHDDPCFAHLYDKGAKKIKYHSSTPNIQQTAHNFLDAMSKKGILS
ncbi:MAG: DNA sulfur modification protein DndB [Bacillus sp. (in: firmicutes)]